MDITGPWIAPIWMVSRSPKAPPANTSGPMQLPGMQDMMVLVVAVGFVGRNFTADVPPNSTSTWQAVANWDYHLWDPKDCRIKACCHEWFQRDVPLSSDDIEVRLCADQSSSTDEDIYVDLVEVYVR